MLGKCDLWRGSSDGLIDPGEARGGLELLADTPRLKFLDRGTTRCVACLAALSEWARLDSGFDLHDILLSFYSPVRTNSLSRVYVCPYGPALSLVLTFMIVLLSLIHRVRTNSLWRV
jgi:hypothetical protein